MATAKKWKGYRIPVVLVTEAQRIARRSEGTVDEVNESEVVRRALRAGLPVVAASVEKMKKSQKP